MFAAMMPDIHEAFMAAMKHSTARLSTVSPPSSCCQKRLQATAAAAAVSPDTFHSSDEAQHCQVQQREPAKQSLPKAPASQQQQQQQHTGCLRQGFMAAVLAT
jgi:hypothetical protein